MRIDPEERLAVRERKIVALLNVWPWKTGGTLIGGYAIAAYGDPRYSKDADIVIPTPLQPTFEDFLRGQGFELEKFDGDLPLDFEGIAPRYRKDETTIDLLVGYVRDRRARVDIPETWISQRVRSIRLKTRTGGTVVSVNVARPEALWVLKLQAGRDQDLIDLYAILDETIEMNEIVSLFRSLRSETLVQKLSQAHDNVASEKLFEDAMSRLRKKRTEENRNKWNFFVERVRHVVEESVKV